MNPTLIFWTVLAAGTALSLCGVLAILVHALSRFVHFATLGYLSQDTAETSGRKTTARRSRRSPAALVLSPVLMPLAALWRFARWLVSPMPEKRKK